MKVHIVLFARIKEIVGEDRLELSFDDVATVASLKSELLQRYPDVSEMLPHCTVSVNHEYSSDDEVLTDGCEVGLIPPVSGG